MFQVKKGSIDIITYWILRDSTTHLPKTSVTITDIDIYYTIEKAAISSKADLTALSAATDAHTDNKGFEIGRGIYRIDFSDIWTGEVGTKVQLMVECSGIDTVYDEVQIIEQDPYLSFTVNDASTTTTKAITTLIGYGNDLFNTNSLILFVSGNLASLARPITDYVSSTGEIDFSAFPAAPDNGSRGKVIGYTA
jgi:hypothetical protein